MLVRNYADRAGPPPNDQFMRRDTPTPAPSIPLVPAVQSNVAGRAAVSPLRTSPQSTCFQVN